MQLCVLYVAAESWMREGKRERDESEKCKTYYK